MDALLTPGQVAERLQLTLHTVYVWLREGRLPGMRVGHQWRVKPEDLDEYLDAARRGPAPHGDGEGDLMDLVALARGFSSQVPTHAWQQVPSDLGDQLDHYVYGLPKKDAQQ